MTGCACGAEPRYRTRDGARLCFDCAAELAPYDVVIPVAPVPDLPARPVHHAAVCWRGHDLTDPHNYQERPNGRRYCKICRNAARRRHRDDERSTR